MIAIKTILFFFAIIATLKFLEDLIIRIMLRNKEYQDGDKMYEDFVYGYISLIKYGPVVWVIMLWTSFYLVNLL